MTWRERAHYIRHGLPYLEGFAAQVEQLRTSGKLSGAERGKVVVLVVQADDPRL